MKAETLRTRGGDAGGYGATTGRPRWVGWFDAVATRYGCQLQGATDVALTNVDVLGYLSEIPIATAYKIRGKLTTAFPATADLKEAEPVFETMPGWHTVYPLLRVDISKGSNSSLRPPYRLFVSNGPRREQMMVR